MAIKHTSGEELSTLPATSGDGSAVLMFPQKKKNQSKGKKVQDKQLVQDHYPWQQGTLTEWNLNVAPCF